MTRPPIEHYFWAEVMQREPHELTRDALFDGALMLWQRKKGYRFGIDSVLLATDLPELARDATVLELGAGQGAVALTMAYQNPEMKVVALERQPGLASLLRRNIAENGLTNVEVIEGDLREHRSLLPARLADLVIFNPPFFPKGQRRPSRDEERAAARHELFGGLDDFLTAAFYALKPRGWIQMISPPLRMPQALSEAKKRRLNLESLRFYHTSPEEEAYLTQFRWRQGGAPDLKILPPLFIYRSEGIYTPEVARRLQRERR